MQIFIPILFFLIVAFAITAFQKFKPIESLFLGIVATIFITFIGALLSWLNQTIIATLILSTLLIIAALIKSIRTKQLGTNLKSFFLNPAILILFLATIANLILFKDIKLSDTDDFRYWAYAVKVFQAYNGFPHIPYFFNPYQTSGIPIFNTFTTTLSTFTETNLIQSQLFFYWALITLPLASFNTLKSKHSIPAFIYATTFFLILPRLPEGFSITSTYNDLTISLLAGVLVTHFLINRKNNKQKYPPVLITGVALLPLVKNGSGMIFSLFVLSILYIDRFYINKEHWKERSPQSKIFPWLLPLVIFVSYNLHNLGQPNSLTEKRDWADPIGSIQHALQTPLGIVLLCLTSIAFITAIIFTLKKVTYQKWTWLITAIFAITLALFLGNNLDGPTKYLIIVYFKNLTHLTFQKNTYHFLLFFGIFIAYLILLLISKKRSRKQALTIPLTLFIQGILFLFLVLFTYTTFSEWEAYQTASLARYLSAYTNYILIILLSITILPKRTSKRHFSSNLFLLASTVLFLILTAINPYDPVHRIHDRINNYQESMQGLINADLAQLTPYLKETDAVFMIVQGDINYPLAKRIAMFNLVPNHLDHTFFTPSNNDTPQQEIDEFTQTIIKNNFTHLYLFNLDDHFIDTYNNMFTNQNAIKNHTYFEIEQTKNTVKFIEIEK